MAGALVQARPSRAFARAPRDLMVPQRSAQRAARPGLRPCTRAIAAPERDTDVGTWCAPIVRAPPLVGAAPNSHQAWDSLKALVKELDDMKAELAAVGGPLPAPEPASDDDSTWWPGVLLPLSVIGGGERPLVPLSGPASALLDQGALEAVKDLLTTAWSLKDQGGIPPLKTQLMQWSSAELALRLLALLKQGDGRGAPLDLCNGSFAGMLDAAAALPQGWRDSVGAGVEARHLLHWGVGELSAAYEIRKAECFERLEASLTARLDHLFSWANEPS